MVDIPGFPLFTNRKRHAIIAQYKNRILVYINAVRR